MTKLRNLKTLCGALLTLLILAGDVLVSDVQAAPAQGDFNGDGLSDLSVALVNRNAGTTAWLTRTGASTSLFWNFTKPGDALVSGKWFGDGKTYPGLVWVRSATLPLEWYVKNPQGSEIFIRYGTPGDSIPNQGDLDCDGVTDFIVTRNGTASRFPGSKIWYVALSGAAGQVAEVPFGLVNDRLAVADMDGDGCSEMIALRDGFQWFSKKLFGTAITQVQWGLPGDYPMLPLDFNLDGQADYIIARPEGGVQRFYLRLSANNFEIINGGLSTAIPIGGNFLGVPFVAWAQRDQGLYAILGVDRVPQIFPFGIASNAIIRPDGTVIQPDDSGKFGSSSGGGSGGGGGGGGSPGGSINDIQCTRTFTSVKNPYVYSPYATKGSKLVLDSRYTSEFASGSSFRVYDTNGTELGRAGPYGTLEEGGRVRSYLNPSARNMPARIHLAAISSRGTALCFTNINSQTKQK